MYEVKSSKLAVSFAFVFLSCCNSPTYSPSPGLPSNSSPNSVCEKQDVPLIIDNRIGSTVRVNAKWTKGSSNGQVTINLFGLNFSQDGKKYKVVYGSQSKPVDLERQALNNVTFTNVGPETICIVQEQFCEQPGNCGGAARCLPQICN